VQQQVTIILPHHRKYQLVAALPRPETKTLQNVRCPALVQLCNSLYGPLAKTSGDNVFDRVSNVKKETKFLLNIQLMNNSL